MPWRGIGITLTRCRTLPWSACCRNLSSPCRAPRLDALETLHHVMVRGLERRVVFWDDVDRDDFLALGDPGHPLVPVLGIRPQNVYRAAAQGQAARAEWERLLATC